MKYENKKKVDELCKEVDELLHMKKTLADTHSLQVCFGRGYNNAVWLEYYTEGESDFNKLAADYRKRFIELVDIKLAAAHLSLSDL